MTIIKIYDSSHESESEYTKFKKCATHEMKEYTDKYGCHFNKALCEFAVNNMFKKGNTIKFLDKNIVDELLDTYNITIENNKHYDAVFVFHMAKADYWGSSIIDEEHMAKYIKDVLDDSDGYEGIAFNRWYADMCMKNITIDWESML